MKKKLSILIYVNSNVNFLKKNLGGIETLNLELYKFFYLQKFEVCLTNKLNFSTEIINANRFYRTR